VEALHLAQSVVGVSTVAPEARGKRLTPDLEAVQTSGGKLHDFAVKSANLTMPVQDSGSTFDGQKAGGGFAGNSDRRSNTS
jgi:hypothetical protein